MSARALGVRDRVVPAAGESAALFDPLVADLLRGGPVSRERLATRWTEGASLRALAEAKRRPLPAALAEEMSAYHRRLGASPESLANLERMARGEAVASVAGQQPAPLGGPLFSLHKIAGAIGLAREAAARTAIPCVPLFWMHGEDSDFAEIRTITVSDASLQLHDLSIAESAHREGELVGGIGLESLDAVASGAREAWEGLPGCNDAMRIWSAAVSRSRNLGEAVNALWLALFADAGLVVVDPRLPSFRAAARDVLDRYLASPEPLHRAARDAGARLEAIAGRRPLADASLDSFVFRVEDGRRHKVAASELATLPKGAVLSPSVALRPAVQDGVFPTVVMACGPGELAYLLQLREVFEGVGVRPAAPAPRFSATWLPPAALELMDAIGGSAWSVCASADAAIGRLAEARVPREAAEALGAARRAAGKGLERFADDVRAFDASLPQMVESARGKIDFQFERLREGLLAKARARLDREHPAWRRLRYVLLPGDKLQERRLVSLEPLARRGSGVTAELVELAGEHAERAAAGDHAHYLLEA